MTGALPAKAGPLAVAPLLALPAPAADTVFSPSNAATIQRSIVSPAFATEDLLTD